MSFDILTQTYQNFDGAFEYIDPMFYLMDYALNQKARQASEEITQDVARNDISNKAEIRDKYSEMTGKPQTQDINGSGRNGLFKRLEDLKIIKPVQNTAKFRFNPSRPMYRPAQPRLTYK